MEEIDFDKPIEANALCPNDFGELKLTGESKTFYRINYASGMGEWWVDKYGYSQSGEKLINQMPIEKIGRKFTDKIFQQCHVVMWDKITNFVDTNKNSFDSWDYDHNEAFEETFKEIIGFDFSKISSHVLDENTKIIFDRMSSTSCFACVETIRRAISYRIYESHRQPGDYCYLCPIKWTEKGKTCTSYESAFSLWARNFEIDHDKEKSKKYSEIIRDLPWQKAKK